MATQHYRIAVGNTVPVLGTPGDGGRNARAGKSSAPRNVGPTIVYAGGPDVTAAEGFPLFPGLQFGSSGLYMGEVVPADLTNGDPVYFICGGSDVGVISTLEVGVGGG